MRKKVYEKAMGSPEKLENVFVSTAIVLSMMAKVTVANNFLAFCTTKPGDLPWLPHRFGGAVEVASS